MLRRSLWCSLLLLGCAPAAPAAPAAATPGESSAGPIAPEAALVETSKGFECSLVLGLAVTGEWFNAGFEKVVDDARWEAILRPHTFVQDWADPVHAAWSEAPTSPCASRADSPDRVLLVVANWDYPSAEPWVDTLKRATVTLTTKYPGVKRIELLTMIRAPGNVSCGDPKSVVSPFVDEAIARVTAEKPELLRSGPRFEVPSCELFTKGGPHFTPEGGARAAKLVAEHYLGDP